MVLERDASFATARRCIPDCRELLATERARRAGLVEPEVVAIVLYTGPMVCPTRPPSRSVLRSSSIPLLPALPAVSFQRLMCLLDARMAPLCVPQATRHQQGSALITGDAACVSVAWGYMIEAHQQQLGVHVQHCWRLAADCE